MVISWFNLQKNKRVSPAKLEMTPCPQWKPFTNSPRGWSLDSSKVDVHIR